MVDSPKAGFFSAFSQPEPQEAVAEYPEESYLGPAPISGLLELLPLFDLEWSESDRELWWSTLNRLLRLAGCRTESDYA